MTTSVHGRAQARRNSRAPRRLALAVAFATALATPIVATTAAQAATATPTATPAAPTAKATKAIPFTVKKSAKTQINGARKSDRIVLTVKTRKAARGFTIAVIARGKTIARAKVKSTRTRVRLPKNLRSGKTKLTVRVTPNARGAANGYRSAKKRVTVKVLTERQAIVAAAKKHIGTPYRYGGTTPKGFDCAGFTKYVFSHSVKVSLPRTSSAQRTAGKKISRAKAKAGDIIWTPGHVAIYLGGNKIIDSPRPGKSIHVRTMYQKNPTFIRVI
ncbi:C40 family peptidase [Rarobacter incanus]|uniref:Cell wall-associated NlpC family hydrolase n=1 Tax=Rarobacter incanus TaxID=153494 RepID=A0A542SQE7_9MICO|nr:C40 family peptidase [Rarobacter incanus]TQK76814.1 cell wall-associated NlpC family hydrolase [Rarobacter incanus]